ncbi:hypothetical protein AZE42_04618 [Rhizopogon vesiculosus]|uniref:PAS domain-containing protein n=1 Tax=Rhizopogon vesiculosus TaxID=180088 RepID=A0A1J8R8H3_9AGAM|nr:hypothetical protein AZE42_04618 [Rhizopogon vesiculosus]
MHQVFIVDFSEEAHWLYLTESVSDLLGFEPRELIGRSGMELVHPDEFAQVKQMHYDTIREDKAAALVYLRLKHKNPFKGYILCAASRTVVHNVVVGSVSFATPGGKALQNASTAQEVEVITASARNFDLRRWGDPSPMFTGPTLDLSLTASSPSTSSYNSDTLSDSNRRKTAIISFNTLPYQSSRSALILDRFSIHCTVLYCSNDILLSTTRVLGRSFFDFVSSRTVHNVRSSIDVIKAWGVNERGQPSDGGFGFGKFMLLPAGRDSRYYHFGFSRPPFAAFLIKDCFKGRRRARCAAFSPPGKAPLPSAAKQTLLFSSSFLIWDDFPLTSPDATIHP